MKSIVKVFITGLVIVFLSCSQTKKIASTQNTEMNSSTPKASLTETYWKLTVLMGKAVTMDSANQKEIHLILKKEGNRVQGFAGCNGFGGTYTTKNNFNIYFSNMLHTMMACPELNSENELFTVLNTVDNYYITGDTLTLSKAKMAPMARFVAVYLK